MDHLEARRAKKRKLEDEKRRNEEFDHKDVKASKGGSYSGPSSSASFLNLKAQLSQRQASEKESSKKETLSPSPSSLPRHLRQLPDADGSASTGNSKQSSKKKSKQSSSSPRYFTTLSSASSTPSARLERSRNAALEKKAKLYDQLKKGLSGGLRPEDLDEGGKYAGAIDWDRKIQQHAQDEDDDDASESDSSHSNDDANEDEDKIEYTDDLGRTRLVPRSQVPMEYLMQMKREAEYNASLDDSKTIYGPQVHFPVFHHDRTEQSEDPPLETHFDASHEVRNRGAAFFQFDKDEQVRKRQMEQLANERKETEMKRKDAASANADAFLSSVAPDWYQPQREQQQETQDEQQKEVSHA